MRICITKEQKTQSTRSLISSAVPMSNCCKFQCLNTSSKGICEHEAQRDCAVAGVGEVEVEAISSTRWQKDNSVEPPSDDVGLEIAS